MSAKYQKQTSLSRLARTIVNFGRAWRLLGTCHEEAFPELASLRPAITEGDTILDEAQEAKVGTPVHIYATGNTAPLSDDLYRFHQIPNSILARLSILDSDEEILD